jgi:hypothetical protein
MQTFCLFPKKCVPHVCVVVAAAILLSGPSVAQAQDNFELNEQTFNQWLFNANQGKFDPDSELSLHIEAVDRVCGLDQSQKEKLRMAGRGDFARFGRQVDDLKAKYVGKTFGQNEIGEIYQKIQPLGQVYQAGLLATSRCSTRCLPKR